MQPHLIHNGILNIKWDSLMYSMEWTLCTLEKEWAIKEINKILRYIHISFVIKHIAAACTREQKIDLEIINCFNYVY